jgi:uncharacterized protein (DUF4415 family)
MKKKSPASSQPVRLNHTKSEDIANRQWSEQERHAIRRIAGRQAAGKEASTGSVGIPSLSADQLAAMVRLREVRKPKIPVSVRLDERVIDWLKSKGQGHLTRVNDILANVMDAELGSKSSR